MWGEARIGQWTVTAREYKDAECLTVTLSGDPLCRIAVEGQRVTATYALPCIMCRADNSLEYGTYWTYDRSWNVRSWDDLLRVSQEIKAFFENEKEFNHEQEKVYAELSAS